MKLREFDLYLDIYEFIACENTVSWTEGCGWAKPDMRVREVSPALDAAYAECERALNFLQEANVVATPEDFREFAHNMVKAVETGKDALAALRKARE